MLAIRSCRISLTDDKASFFKKQYALKINNHNIIVTKDNQSRTT